MAGRPIDYREIRRRVDAARLAVERELLAAALERNGWVVARAARELGCWLSTLQKAIDRHPDLRKRIGGPGRPRGV